MNGVRHPDLFGFVRQDDAKIVYAGKPTSNSTLAGRYAEFMVCAYLTKMGHTVIHVDTHGFDLILNYDGNSYRIDVKSTDNSYSGVRRQTAYFHVGKSYWLENSSARTRRRVTQADCDMLALFYNPLEAVAFYPVLNTIKKVVDVPLVQLRNDQYGQTSLVDAIRSLETRGGTPKP